MPYPFPGEKKEAMKVEGSALSAVILLPKGFKSEYPKPNATDSINVVLDWKDAEESDGVARFKGVTLAKEMVQDYADIGKVYKAADELKAAVPYLALRPVTTDHPMMGMVTDRTQICGLVENPVMEGPEIKADLSITCDSLKKEIKDGTRREVSIGFHADWDMTPGKFGDQEYDGVQRNILIDHVAVVPNGRCSLSEGCGITLEIASEGLTGDQTEATKQAVAALEGKISALIEKAFEGWEKKVEKAVKAELKTGMDASEAASKESSTRMDGMKGILDKLVEIVGPGFAVDEDPGSDDAGRAKVNEAYRKVGRG